MLEAREIACARGERRLFSNISFQLARGESLAIHGANGSGKSSLLRILCTLLPAVSGEVRWQGENVYKLGEDYRRVFAYIGHLNGLKEELSAWENLRAAVRLTNGGASAVELTEALSRMELQRVRDLPVRFLSQGQKRRVALSRLALNLQPPLWILDEPLAALDSRAGAIVTALMRSHLDSGGIIIAATHTELAPTRRITLSDASEH
ncbi:MAG: cytochrome c biogenesis heme-transporting ATPase CcmA [Burkholderiales bacterium]